MLFKNKSLKGLECLNCEMPLKGDENFCASCGQKNDVRKLRVSHFFTEFLAGFISYDSTLWRTLKPLLFSPGEVSLEYIQGKRKRYVNPFRFYFLMSIIYFLMIGLSSKYGVLNTSFEQRNGRSSIDVQKGFKKGNTIMEGFLHETDSIFDQNNTPVLDSESDQIESIYFLKKIKQADRLFRRHRDLSVVSIMDSLQVEPSFFNKAMYHKIMIYSVGDDEDNLKVFFNAIVSKISISLFFLLPIFTCFVWLVYFRKRYSYMEHLVFVFNTQTVLFLLFIIFFCVDSVFGTESQWSLAFILFSVYLFLALRGFYKQSFFKTLIKFFILNGMYIILTSVGFVFITVVSFLFS